VQSTQSYQVRAEKETTYHCEDFTPLYSLFPCSDLRQVEELYQSHVGEEVRM